MKKPVRNKIARAFEDRAANSTKTHRGSDGAGEHRSDRAADLRSKPPKVVYKRRKQAIVESMTERMAEDAPDEPVAAISLATDRLDRNNPHSLQDQPQQQQQSKDLFKPDDDHREQASGLSMLRWADLKQRKWDS